MKFTISVLVFVATAALRLSGQVEVIGNGNVGIGTSTPASKLSVVHSTDASIVVEETGGANLKLKAGSSAGYFLTQSDHPLYLGANGNSQLVTVLPAGNVGIGTTAPADKLHVIGSLRVDGSTFPSLLFFNGSSPLAAMQVDVANGRMSIGDLYGSAPSLALGLFTADVERLRIDTAGNVGIGTNSPDGYRLRVMGGDENALKIDTNGATDNPAIFLAQNGTSRWEIYGGNSELGFYDYAAGVWTMWLAAGNVGIGTQSPSHKLHVAGSVRATSFISDTQTYADFVFKPDYRLPALSEVEAHIKERGHLPGIPSEDEARTNGIDLARMQVQLLQKIEELTLYMIEVKRENEALRSEIEKLKIGRP
jgi:hypothetical protein